MKATPFDTLTDLAPTPFDERHCELAASLKEAGLPWRPHVGCFVHDPDQDIGVPSPFPNRIYFILNLGHFLRLLGTVDDVKKRLIWLPTWHQTRLLCALFGVKDVAVSGLWSAQGRTMQAGDDLLALYELLLKALKDRK
jgi:hypothetical protein